MAVVGKAVIENSANKPEAGPYRIMLVDDSAVIRGMMTRWLSADADFEIVASCHNGAHAVQHITASGAEIVILDIEMPEMDGLTALPLLIKKAPGLQVIMASTLTRRNADISMRALSLGAVDYIPKPESARSGTASADFQRDLIQKLRLLGARLRRRTGNGKVISSLAPAQFSAGKSTKSKVISLRKPSSQRPEIIAIGSSTGGPQALFTLLTGLGKAINVPIVITQHMPPTFTAILAEHIQSLTGIPAREATTGEVVKPNQILVAPGDYHMRLERSGTDKVIKLDKSPPVNFCRPAVDPMFASIAGIYGRTALGVVLTGMGHDGRQGGQCIADAGGSILAQDDESSVVWGMPGAVAEAGLCSAVVPLSEMAPLIKRYLQGISL